jgi:hypothetical protein
VGGNAPIPASVSCEPESCHVLSIGGAT